MPKSLRDEVAGGTFHVMNRGNRRQRIYEDDRDRRRFLRIFAEEQQNHATILCGGCQMGSHFHAIVTTPHGNLSDFVGAFQSRYAQYSNWRHGNVGHLFQGRYRGVYVGDDVQLLTAMCYVFLNPVSAGFVRRIEDYRWSTYRATAGLDPVPRYLSLEWLRTLFPGDRLSDAQRQFRGLMEHAKPAYAYFSQHEAAVDADAVKRVIRSYTGEQLQLGRMPRLYRTALRAPLDDLFPSRVRGSELGELIYEARVTHGYTLVEITRHLRIHAATASRLFRSASQRRR